MHKKIAVGITGASGSIYAKYFLKFLASLSSIDVYLIISPCGERVIEHELGVSVFPPESERNRDFLFSFLGADAAVSKIKHVGYMDFFSPIASGSFVLDGMVVCPCSMGTVARIRHGVSTNLLERTADVMIKEGRSLVLLTRETPLSSIHLENMLALSKVGVRIVPASPAFYHHPKSLDDIVNFMVARLAHQLGINNSLAPVWQEE